MLHSHVQCKCPVQIVDILDCTGSGDVDTSRVVKADESGCIQGLYDNKLQVNSGWSNPSGGLSCPIPCSKPVMYLQKLTRDSKSHYCLLKTLIIDVQSRMSVMVGVKHPWHSLML